MSMSFSTAIKWLKNESDVQKIARSGWNGKGMFVFLVSDWTCGEEEAESFDRLPFLAMKTADNKIVPWLASQTDILADDWEFA